MSAEIWGERWSAASLDMAREYMETAARKQSLVCLAADCKLMSELFDLIEKVGPYIAALKTHVDLVDDWTEGEWRRFCLAAKDADLLIFEDRKFADIGKDLSCANGWCLQYCFVGRFGHISSNQWPRCC